MHSLEADSPLESLREYAESEEIPIIRREMESFIRVLLDIKRPGTILEIGTGIAYSASFMAICAPDAHITTIENYPPRIEKAREVITDLGFSERITLIEDDAAKVLEELSGSYDLIFLDAAKGQYISFLPNIIRLLEPGGILLADNVLQGGDLIESRYITQRRQRTIHERMREFIWQVKHNGELDTSLIPIGDGVTLSVRKHRTG